MTRRDRSENY